VCRDHAGVVIGSRFEDRRVSVAVTLTVVYFRDVGYVCASLRWFDVRKSCTNVCEIFSMDRPPPYS